MTRMLSAFQSAAESYEAAIISPAEVKRLLDEMLRQLVRLMNRCPVTGTNLLHFSSTIILDFVAKIDPQSASSSHALRRCRYSSGH